MRKKMTPYEGKKPYVFMSYSRADAETVQPLIERLGKKYRIWYGGENVTKYFPVIEERVKNCAAFLLFMSGDSITDKAVELQVNHACENRKKVLIARLDGCEMPSSYQWRLHDADRVNISGMESETAAKLLSKGLKKLMNRLGAVLAKAAAAAAALVLLALIGAVIWTSPTVQGTLDFRSTVDDVPENVDIYYLDTVSYSDRGVSGIPFLVEANHWENPDAVFLYNNLRDSYISQFHFEYTKTSNGKGYGVEINDDLYFDSQFQYELIIPRMHDGLPVVSIDATNIDPTSLERVVIPDTVTDIGDNCFSDCVKLKYVYIPDSVTAIGERCFYNCTSLELCYVPDSIFYVGDYSFSECPNLTNLHIPAALKKIPEHSFCINSCERIYVPAENENYCTKNGVLYTKALKTLVRYPCGSKEEYYTIPAEVEQIDDSAFVGRNNLAEIDVNWLNRHFVADQGVLLDRGRTKLYCYPGQRKKIEYVVPDSVKEIGDYSFFGASKLASVTLPDGLRKIGNYTFSMAGLKRITIPNGVSELGIGCFYGDAELVSVSLPNSLEKLPDRIFEDCSSLTEIIVPENVTELGEYAFKNCKALGSVSLPDGLEFIGNQAFYDCDSLIQVDIPQSVSSWGDYLFSLCDKLQKLNLPKHPTGEISTDYMCWQCGKLAEIILPDNLVSIGDFAFSFCESLKEVDIPPSVKRIETSAFWQCTGLKKVTLHEGVERIGNSAFGECASLTSIRIPESVEYISAAKNRNSFEHCIITVYAPKPAKDYKYEPVEGVTWVVE